MATTGKRGASRQSRKGRLFLALLIVLAVALVVNNQYVVKGVQVTGNNRRTAEEIIARSGISMGMSMFKLDDHLIRREVESDPYLRLDEVIRRYPSTVELVVQERQACAALSNAGVVVLIDSECRVLEVIDQLPGSQTMMVTGVETTSRRVGYQLETSKPTQVDHLAKVLTAIGEQAASSLVSELNVEDLDNIYLVSRTGVQVMLGDSELLGEKLTWFTVVLDQLSAEGVTGGVLDVSSGKNAVYSDH